MNAPSPSMQAVLRKERRLLVQYALGGGLFMGVAIWLHNAWLALPVYGLLIVLLVLRFRRTAQILRYQAQLLAPTPAEKNPAGEGGAEV